MHTCGNPTSGPPFNVIISGCPMSCLLPPLLAAPLRIRLERASRHTNVNIQTRHDFNVSLLQVLKVQSFKLTQVILDGLHMTIYVITNIGSCCVLPKPCAQNFLMNVDIFNRVFIERHCEVKQTRENAVGTRRITKERKKVYKRSKLDHLPGNMILGNMETWQLSC